VSIPDLAGKVAVVTGAGSGIGRALACRFAHEEMRVVVADVEQGALDETVSLLSGDVLARRPDVSRAEDVDALADAAYARFGATHVLCNNAGVFQGGVVWERTDADWDWTLGVNLFGIVHGIRAFVSRMIEQGDEGHVVNTASYAGLVSAAFCAPYTVSKYAAVVLSECHAHDLRASGSRIGVSVLCPSAVDTRIADSARNRPGDAAMPDDARFVADALRDLASRGLDPADVASVVVDAIRTDRFYVPTNASYDDLVRGRCDDMLARTTPRSVVYD
jgi:NAD(P)-dependent dehydrogenase (short-subunit alcohol dehydrogenase family)